MGSGSMCERRVAGALLVGLVTWLAACGLEMEAPPDTTSSFMLPSPESGHVRWNNDPTTSFSPDGAFLAHLVFQDDGTRQMHLWDMATRDRRPVSGTVGGDTAFFSPDGQWLGFFADGRLKKVPVGGGEATALTPEAMNLRGASWGPSGTIVFNLTDTDVLYEVSVEGGEPQQLTELAEGELSHRWPQFLPDGSAVLFTISVSNDPQDSQIAALQLDTGEKKILVRGGTFGRYAATGQTRGQLVYHRERAILAVGFDPATLDVMGVPTVVQEGVLGSPPDTLTGVAQFTFSNTGTLAYVAPEQVGGDATIYRISIVPDWFEEIKQRVAAGP